MIFGIAAGAGADQTGQTRMNDHRRHQQQQQHDKKKKKEEYGYLFLLFLGRQMSPSMIFFIDCEKVKNVQPHPRNDRCDAIRYDTQSIL